MTQLPEEAIEAGARALHAEFSRAYGIRGTIWDDYKLEARATIHAAYPAIEKQVRAEVAAEIREAVKGLVKIRIEISPGLYERDIRYEGLKDAYAHAARIADGDIIALWEPEA